MKFAVVSLGDSIMWGQGLLKNQKFVHIVADAIRQKLPSGSEVEWHQFAHSASAVWKNPIPFLIDAIDPFPKLLPTPRTPSQQEIDVEVAPEKDPIERDRHGEFISPVPYTWCQISAAAKSLNKDQVFLVLLNGGINDTGLFNILMPYKHIPSVLERILSFKGYTQRLLTFTHSVFPKARIIVPGYYRLVSSKTNFDFYLEWVSAFLRSCFQSIESAELVSRFGFNPDTAEDVLAIPSHDSNPMLSLLSPIRHNSVFSSSLENLIFQPVTDIQQRLINLSALFEWKIHEVLMSDIKAFNTFTGSEKAFLVKPGFSDDNSVYAPDSLLWELNKDLEPIDPMKQHRKELCKTNPALEFACYRASLGHPNIAGSRVYGKAIVDEIESWAQ